MDFYRANQISRIGAQIPQTNTAVTDEQTHMHTTTEQHTHSMLILKKTHTDTHFTAGARGLRLPHPNMR